MTRNPRYVWSALTALLGRDNDRRTGALLRAVLTQTSPGDTAAVVDLIDRFSTDTSYLMTIGQHKGALVESIVGRVQPSRMLELGTYCGYSALRTIRSAPPTARLVSLDIEPAFSDIAEQIWRHAGDQHRISAVVGDLADDFTVDCVRSELGSSPADYVLVDHDKGRYLSDVRLLIEAGLIAPGTVVVADNIRIPGAPDYLRHMRSHEGRDWTSREHRVPHPAAPRLSDVVLESTYLG